MRKVLLLSLFLVILISSCTQNPYASLENNPKVDLKLVKMAESSSLERVHALIQFNHIPYNSEKKILDENNVTLHNYKGEDSYLASISVSEINNISKLPFINEIKEVPVNIKIVEHFWKNRIPGYVMNDDGSLNLIVVFYDDVSEKEAIEIVNKYGTVVYSEYPGLFSELYVTIKKELVIDFAKEDKIKYIDFIPGMPGPATINSLNSSVIVKTDKSSYTQGEIVRISVINLKNKTFSTGPLGPSRRL